MYGPELVEIHCILFHSNYICSCLFSCVITSFLKTYWYMHWMCSATPVHAWEATDVKYVPMSTLSSCLGVIYQYRYVFILIFHVTYVLSPLSLDDLVGLIHRLGGPPLVPASCSLGPVPPLLPGSAVVVLSNYMYIYILLVLVTSYVWDQRP